jgi:ribonuclease HII
MKAQLRLPLPPGKRRSLRAFEDEAYGRGFQVVAGVDEVGRGPLAGPVVAAAVILPREFHHQEIKDSKLLSAKQREKLAPLIQQSALSWGIGVVEFDEIDRINILQASLLAMAKALTALSCQPDCLLIDGKQPIPVKLFHGLSFSVSPSFFQKTIVKGDQLSLSIAAASIVAKVARDAMMVALDKQYPQYGFADHKGYACATHLAALRQHGPSPIHRLSYKPVRDLALAR